MGISLLRKKVFLGYLGQVRHASQELVQNKNFNKLYVEKIKDLNKILNLEPKYSSRRRFKKF